MSVLRESQIGVVPTYGTRLPGIEGLRAAAACSVLAYHTWASSSDGPVSLGPLSRVVPDLAFGVTLFFALSGFLLYRPFVASVLRNERLPSVGRYFRNRGLRILPAYWVILLVAGLLLDTVLVRRGDALGPGELDQPLLLLQTATFTQNYSPSTVGSGIGPAWSLAIEAVFYLLLPLLALGGLRLARGRATRRGAVVAMLAPAATLLLVGLAGKAVAGVLVPGPQGEWGATWHTVVELSFLGQADLFSFGMALAVLYVLVEDGRVRLPRLWRGAAVVAGLASYLVVARGTHLEDQLSSAPENTLMAFACALLLALVVLPTAERRPRPPLLVRVLELRPVVAVGLASYSVFLWHGPLIRWLHAHDLTLDGQLGLLVNLVVVLGLTLALSTLTYRYVEVPALRLRSGGRRGRVIESDGAASVSAAP